MAMELSHLRTFLAVAEAGQITLAAKKLHLSQPSVTVAVQLLERHLGVALFVRRPGGIELTAAGAEFRVKASAVLAAADDAVATARRAARYEEGTLRVGVHGPAWPEVAATLNAFHRARPHVTLLRRELTLLTQEHALLRGQVDIVFNVGVPDDCRLLVQHLRQEARVMAVPRHHRLADQDRLRLDDVLDERFIALHPAIPRWCGSLFALSEERGRNARFTEDEAGTASEVISLVTQEQGLFSAPSRFARGMTPPGLRWRTVDGLTPVTLDVVSDPTNRNPLVRELADFAVAMAKFWPSAGPARSADSQ